MGPRLNELPHNRAVVLDNVTCVYCNTQLDEANSSKEHIVGRRFVPKGKLSGEWNLIVRACNPCNARKAGLEDDISAVTMLPDPWGRGGKAEDAPADATRKAAGSISRRTAKPVGESIETWTFTASFLGGTLRGQGEMPPQIDPERVWELARLQLVGFFYWLTYNQGARIGHFWLGDFYPLDHTARLDWGNVIQRAFMSMVLDWEPRLMGATGDGYFKVAIRRSPTDVLWSWALEWNRNYRVIGFFGEQEAADKIRPLLPRIPVYSVVEGPDRWIRVREEVRLPEDDDCLFQWQDSRLL